MKTASTKQEGVWPRHRGAFTPALRGFPPACHVKGAKLCHFEMTSVLGSRPGSWVSLIRPVHRALSHHVIVRSRILPAVGTDPSYPYPGKE